MSDRMSFFFVRKECQKKNMLRYMPDTISENMLGRMPECMSDRNKENISDGMLDTLSQKHMSVRIPDRLSESMADKFQSVCQID